MQSNPNNTGTSGASEDASDPTYTGTSKRPEEATDPTYTGPASSQVPLPAEEATPLYTHHGEGQHSHKHLHAGFGFHLHRHQHEGGDQEHVHGPDDELNEQNPEHHLAHSDQPAS